MTQPHPLSPALREIADSGDFADWVGQQLREAADALDALQAQAATHTDELARLRDAYAEQIQTLVERASKAEAEAEAQAHELETLKAQWARECDDADRLIRSALGLDPADYRTEGGSLMVEKLRAYLVGDRV